MNCEGVKAREGERGYVVKRKFYFMLAVRYYNDCLKLKSV